MKITQTLYQQLKIHQGKRNTALFFHNKKITYHSLLQRIDNMAEKLYLAGIRKNYVVTLISGNIPEAIVTLFALNKIGAIISLLDRKTPKNVFFSVIKESKSSFLIIEDIFYPEYQEWIKDTQLSTFTISSLNDLGGLGKKLFHHDHPNLHLETDRSKLLDSLIKNSNANSFVSENSDVGKTSIYLQNLSASYQSKTLAFNDYALSQSGAQIASLFSKEKRSLSFLSVLSLSQLFGLSLSVLAPLSQGYTCFLLDKFSVKEIVNAINGNKVNVLVSISYINKKLMQSSSFRNGRLKNLIANFSIADFINDGLQHDYNELMKKKGSTSLLNQGLFFNECTSFITLNYGENYFEKTAGKVISPNYLRIVNPKDREEEYHHEYEGEILINGESLCLGYLSLPYNYQPFFNDSRNFFWFCSNQLGYFRKDGYLLTRKQNFPQKEILTYPIDERKIEVIVNDIEGVNDAKAIYVESEHPYIELFIENHDSDDKLLKKEIEKALKEYLYPYFLPKKIVFYARFPRRVDNSIDEKALMRNYHE